MTSTYAPLDRVSRPSSSFANIRSKLSQQQDMNNVSSRERPKTPGPLARGPGAQGSGHDFAKIRVQADGQVPQVAGSWNGAVPNYQSGTPTAAPSALPPPAPTGTPAAAAPKVDKIDIVDSPTGAIAGYPPITSGNLNAPGPFNNPATGAVNNVHQIHFHLDSGSSAALTPARIVRGSNWLGGAELKHPQDQVLPPGVAGPPAPGGFSGVLDAPDGPGAHEIKRPSTDKIVVADAPGIGALSASQYPYVHKSTFTLTVMQAGGAPVAQIQYGVRIEKKSATDVPNTENRIFAISKLDMVRGRTLP